LWWSLSAIDAAGQARRRRNRFVAIVHARRLEETRDSRAQLKKGAPVDPRLHDMDVQITPCHQAQRVASNNVNPTGVASP